MERTMTQATGALPCVITCVATVVGLGGQDGIPISSTRACCAPSLQERRPVQDAGARLDHRRPGWSAPRASLHVLRGDLDWRCVQDHKRRRDVHASVRSSEQADDRGRRHRAFEFQGRLGRNRRDTRRPQLVPRRRHLQVGRCRRDVDEWAPRLAPHLARRDPPDRTDLSTSG